MKQMHHMCHHFFTGDAVVLERWTSDRFKLHLHIVKDASDSTVAATTISKGKAKRATARKAHRSAKTKSPSISSPACSLAHKTYSPDSLEALHDAALLCANSPSPDPSAGTAAASYQGLASSDESSGFEGGSGVPAAAVAAADAAALHLEGSQLAMAAGLVALKADSEHQQPVTEYTQQ